MVKNIADESANDYLNAYSKFTEAYYDFIKRSMDGNENKKSFSPYQELPSVWSDMVAKAMENPEKLYSRQIELYGEYLKVWNNAWGRYVGEETEPLYEADPRDKRFKDETWNKDVVFDFIKQSYLLTRQWMQETIGELEGVDKKTSEKFDFYTRQFVDAMSPSNFAFTNPEVIRETINTKGDNLLKGMHNLIHDMEHSRQFLKIKTFDEKAFKIGENIAATPGKVIFKNDLMELIQYSPVCKKTYKTPLLIIPAWINKYYILDLSEHNSFVKWAVEKGFTVFMISWVNPDKKLATKKFEDYMLEGPLAALDAIEKATGESVINAMGYCLGGTLLACTLSYMKTKGDTRIKSATLLTTMVDFSDVGDMSVFIDEQQLDKLDKKMQEAGYLDGNEISAMFSALRANDLIWSFVVNNYLLGKMPLPFDIMYWNADVTRLPADTHSFYLRSMYLNNVLRKPGGITLDNVPIDVTKIDVPTYMLSTREDHIAPWKTTYETTQLFKGTCKFVLAGSGHIAGVVNPPAKKKYGYWTNDKNPKSSDKWLKDAAYYEGSWWVNWCEWNTKFSDEKIPAPKPGSGKLKPLMDAPGSYVKLMAK